LDFQFCEISLADSVWKAQTHHHAKYRQNWSSVVETLQFFEFSKWTPSPSWIFEIGKFYWLLGREVRDTSECQTLSKSVNRLQRYQDFFVFSRWRPPPSWIVESTRYYWLTVSGGPTRIILPNVIKIGSSIAAILRFYKISKWRLLPSWIFELVKFIGYCGRQGRDASACQISSK